MQLPRGKEALQTQPLLSYFIAVAGIAVTSGASVVLQLQLLGEPLHCVGKTSLGKRQACREERGLIPKCGPSVLKRGVVVRWQVLRNGKYPQ